MTIFLVRFIKLYNGKLVSAPMVYQIRQAGYKLALCGWLMYIFGYELRIFKLCTYYTTD